MKKQKEEKKDKEKEVENNTSQKKEIIKLPAFITVKELAEVLKASVSDVISILIKNGVSAAINDTIDYETAAVIALDLGIETKQEKIEDKDQILDIRKIIDKEDKKNLVGRAPVVTVMGHVDHGKTLLLDAIRETNVVATESGGITQHIGAYQIALPTVSGQEKNGKMITFLDTPGHEAFASMRARGVSVTDIVVLVVAAEDKVQPQTIESIKHAQGASLPIIVAINKIDKKEADPERIKKELSKHGLVPEDWGGKTIFVSVSAKTKEGINDLLEMILLVAEMEELKANPKVSAVGTVLESHVDKGKGSVATILIMNGSLKPMNNFVIGEFYGKVRIMENFLGQKINKAGPATPVIISGFSGLPQTGDTLEVVEDEQEAKNRAAEALKAQHIKKIAPSLKNKTAKEKKYELKLILKADVSGSLEALVENINKIENPEVSINIIYQGVGDIVESDVFQASSVGGEIIGFHLKVTPAARKATKQTKVKITLYKVIYELIQDIKEKMIGLLPPEIKEVMVGKLKILQIFRSGKGETILGGKVTGGQIIKNSKVKVFRGDEEIGKGVILNVKKVDKDVKEVKKGEECGISFRGEVDLLEQDVIESIKEEVIKRTV